MGQNKIKRTSLFRLGNQRCRKCGRILFDPDNVICEPCQEAEVYPTELEREEERKTRREVNNPPLWFGRGRK